MHPIYLVCGVSHLIQAVALVFGALGKTSKFQLVGIEAATATIMFVSYLVMGFGGAT